MNKEQEEIALKIIKKLKDNNGIIYARHLGEIDGVTTIILKLLEDLNLIKLLGGGAVRLKDKGFEFESFEKLNYENRLNIDLAESNIRANNLNERNSKFNRYTTFVNIAIGIINLLIFFWQIL